VLHIYIFERRLMVRFTPWPLYSQGKKPLFPLNRRLSVSSRQSGRFAREKNFASLLGVELRVA